MKNLVTALVMAGILAGIFVFVITRFSEDQTVIDDPGSVETASHNVQSTPSQLPKPEVGDVDVRGVVKFQSGDAAPGAQVVAFILEENTGGSLSPRLMKKAMSDAQGVFL